MRFVCKQVKLGEPGWRERYYEEKFSVTTIEEMERLRKDVVSFENDIVLVLPVPREVVLICLNILLRRF